MNLTGIKAITAGLVTLTALTVFALTFIRSVAYSPENEIPLPVARVEQGSPTVPTRMSYPSSDTASYPTRLIIPSIRIDARVQHAGIAASGNMMPPSNFTDVGWYKYGAPPGKQGSAVFAGHVDNALSLPGVFSRLHEVEEGDDIYVRNAAGKLLRFRVISVNNYNYKNVPTDVIFNQQNGARIRLITCGGAWIQSEKSYDTRLVVTAELVV